MGKNRIVLGSGDTADFFNVTTRSLGNWKASGCPCDARGKWDLRAVLDWWLENIYEGGGGKEESVGDIGAAKLAYWRAHGERERLRVDRERAALIPVDDVHTAWAERVSEVCAGLENLVFRLPGLLEGKAREDMAGIIRGEVRALRANYARPGEHCEGGSDGME